MRKATELNTSLGIARRYGGDQELDLIPIDRTEDSLYCVEGSLLAYYCEVRLRERSAEDALCAIMATSKRQICQGCKKLITRCDCPNNFDNFFAKLLQR